MLTVVLGFSQCGSLPLGLQYKSERSPGEGNDNPYQYSYLEKCHGQRHLVGYSPWDYKEFDMTEQLNTFFFFFQLPPLENSANGAKVVCLGYVGRQLVLHCSKSTSSTLSQPGHLTHLSLFQKRTRKTVWKSIH